MGIFRDFFYKIICFSLSFCFCFLTNVKNTYADSKSFDSNKQLELQRSIESLRDLDYQTWQLIVYPNPNFSNQLILRVVGYPGSLRMDHPTNLIVKSGRKSWDLQDITQKSESQIKSLSDSAAEFDLRPLIDELDKNRPLKFSLPGLINDLSIPPYLVSEWRTLSK